MVAMSFVPLYLRSGFSYLQSSLTAEKIPSLAIKRGCKAAAIADCNLAGYAPFAHAASKAGITPLFGYEAKLEKNESVLLYASNEDGYRELLRLSYLESTRKLVESDIHLPFDGLISVFPYRGGSKPLPGIDYVGLLYGLDPTKRTALRETYGTRLVALPLIAYFEEADQTSLAILTSIDKKVELEDVGQLEDQHWPTSEEVSSYYLPEEIDLTEKIAGICGSFSLIKKRGSLLLYPVPEGESEESYLRKKTIDGLLKRKGSIPPEYQKRLDYELGIIARMGYSSYFLIVSDYVAFAKDHGISVGPGRGSAGGSLVAYALNIVIPDPMKYNLLFERFLNPERKTMPDIDVDFSDVRRDEVVAYLFDRYPGSRVARVLTSQTIGAREAVRDAGKALKYTERELKLISSAIDPFLSLADNYRKSREFHDLVKTDPYYLNLAAKGSKIEGLPRQRGIHAAGVIIDQNPLPSVAPCREEEGNGLVVNLEKDYLEEQGFLKFDILGLRNLSILDLILNLVEKETGKRLRYEDLDIDDPKAISLVAEGKTMGLFQLESAGMRRTLKEVRPSSFNDVAAVLALYRPGPMDSIPTFARRKKGLEKVTYIAKELAPILDETYGIIVYQEQIMLLAEAYAGYSFGEADVLRRAISKKNQAVMKEGRSSFVERSIKKGHPKEEAERVYDLIERFASYGFNKSHAVSYAYITMYLAYLKAHYPKAFYAGYLSFLSVDDQRFNLTLSEMRELGLGLSSPSVEGPYFRFEPRGDRIAIPLSYVKRMPSPLVRGIEEERKKGPFKDYFDLARRLLPYGLKQEHLVSLVDSGALDVLGETRSTLRASSYQAIQYANLFGGETGMECLLELNIAAPSLNKREREPIIDMDAEEEALGMIVSVSPFLPYQEAIEKSHALPLSEGVYKDRAVVYCLVESVKAITTKAGKRMAFLGVHDETFHAEGLVFAEAYDRYYPLLKPGKALLLKIERDRRDEGKFILNEAMALAKGD